MIKEIVLLDDEASVLFALKLLLEALGFSVHDFSDPHLALEYVGSDKIADLFLCDLKMPKMNGLDATRQIRKLPGHQSTPILAMTANAFAEDKDRCFEIGMDDFITKPIQPEILYETLLKWLERHRA